VLKGAVIGGFRVVGEGAGGQLAHLQVISDAVTANPFSGAWGIGAIAVLQVAVLFTVHKVFHWLASFDTIILCNTIYYIEKDGDDASV